MLVSSFLFSTVLLLFGENANAKIKLTSRKNTPVIHISGVNCCGVETRVTICADFALLVLLRGAKMRPHLLRVGNLAKD